MKNKIRALFLILLLSSCAEAEKSSFDNSNPLAMLVQFGWSLGLVPPKGAGALEFVAVGSNCSSWTSGDGTTWKYSATRFPGCTNGSVYSVAYGNGTWVAVGTLTGTTGCGIWSSQDGETWTQSSCGAGMITISGTPTSVIRNLYTVTFGGGRFFAAGDHIAAQTGVGFFGQISNDGKSWQFLAIPDGSTYIGTDYFSFSTYSAANSEIYFSGFHSVNSELAQFSLPSLTNSDVSISTPSSKNGVLALKSGKVFVFGGNTDVNPTASFAKIGNTVLTVASSGTFNTAVPGFINSAVEGKDKIVVFGNQCALDYYDLTLQVWHPAASPNMSQCSGLDWMSSTYNSTLDLFVSGGSVSTNIPTAFGFSKTGLPSDWTVVTQGDAGSPGPSILGIATK
ncbi:hypothetical protein JWG45_11810 [Leptospira sp. 201903070]|uniref:Galactose oxidase n=1 Tax=Leptospira ainlahdjerensis TaxID=2810033 RepID=A0ABS2UBT3_9LEPT|nr:hypothetical protein [Leptospira ainlahdjerensis]MBM9577831.1 hypothetical protein [Leptospira ainlahdjerensis]